MGRDLCFERASEQEIDLHSIVWKWEKFLQNKTCETRERTQSNIFQATLTKDYPLIRGLNGILISLSLYIL